MFNENVMSAPHSKLASGYGPLCSVEICEPHLESGKLLLDGLVSYCAPFQALSHPFPFSQILEIFCTQHEQKYQKRHLESGNVYDGYIYHSQRRRLDVISGRKLAKSSSFSVHRCQTDWINTLPDELLCQIFHFLSTDRDRFASASVCKRWLMLQSHMSRGDFLESDTSKGGPKSQDRKFKGETDSYEDGESEVHLEGYDGDLSRCLSGRKASDVRLAAIALGTQSCGGLGKLSIRDGSATGFKLSLTDVGLSAIGSWCSGLRVLSLWNCPYITDQGLASIGNGCHILEKVDLYKCPLVGDSGLQVIAKRCPRLSYLNLDECEKISDVALVAVAEHCANLTILTLQNCPQVSDHGITKVVCNLKMLKKLKLSGLRLTGRSLESIGTQEGDLSWLTLQNLDQVGPDGFVCITHPRGLHKLKHLHIADCRNFTDFSLSMVAKCCGNLKHFLLHKCDLVSDKGLILFMQSVPSLQVLHLEKCNMISGTGIVSALSVRGKELREFQIKKCAGVHEVQAICPPIPDGSALQSICITDCPDVGDLLVALVGLLCKEAVSIDFSGLQNITDDGLLAFLCGGGSKLTSLKLSGCCKISDRALCVIVQEGGQMIRNLALDGCKNLSDKSLKAISSNCPFLEDLDISDCAITNAGLEDLVSSNGQMLSSLNLSGCVGVTDRSLSSILKNCDHLQDLNLKNCKGISEKAASAFQSRKLNCMVLY